MVSIGSLYTLGDHFYRPGGTVCYLADYGGDGNSLGLQFNQ